MRFVPILITVVLVSGCRQTALRAPRPLPPPTKAPNEQDEPTPTPVDEVTPTATAQDGSDGAPVEPEPTLAAAEPEAPVEGPTDDGADATVEDEVVEIDAPDETGQAAAPAQASGVEVPEVPDLSGHDELGPAQLVPEPPESRDAEMLEEGESSPAQLEEDAELEWDSPRLLRTELVIGADVTTRSGRRWGRIEDLLLDGAGAVAGVRTTRILADATRLPRVVAYQPEEWRVQGARVEWVLAGGDEPQSESDFGELFETQEAETVEGEVIAIEVADSEPVHAITLKMRDDNNVLHRAFVEGAPLVLQHMPSVATGETLAIRAHLTRDDVGKLWVATSLASQDESVEIRDASGAVQWKQLADGFLSARALQGATLETADGNSVVITDLLLDHERGAVSALCVEVGGIEHLLDWQHISIDPNGRRFTSLSVVELAELQVPEETLSPILLSPSD